MKKHFFLALCSCALFMGCAHTSPSTSTTPPNLNNKVEIENTAAAKEGFDSLLSSYTYPFEVKYFEFESQNQKMKMAYMDIPSGKNTGKTIVLFHGKNFSGAYFHELILGLNQEGYRVIIPDQIGFGKSSKPASYQYSFQTLASNTKLLLDSLAVTNHYLLGHSMGGMLATRYTLMFPQGVKKLFLVNPIGLEDYRILTSYKPIDELYKNELQQTPESIKNYQLVHYYDRKWKSDYDRWTEIPIGWLKGPDKELIAWNAALTADMIFTQPVVYEFSQLQTPTVLIIGNRDTTAIGKAWATPEKQRLMGDYKVLGKKTAQAIQGSKLYELPGLGHLPFIENFELFWKNFVKELR